MKDPISMTGVIKNWVAARGFGFIARDDGAGDVFCHISDLIDDVDELRPGQRVKFIVREDPRTKKSRAADVVLIDAGGA